VIKEEARFCPAKDIRSINLSRARAAPSLRVHFRGSNVYVGNLPWSVGTEELKDFMQSAGGEVAHVEVLRDGIGRSKGCGIVRFVNAEQAQNGAPAGEEEGAPWTQQMAPHHLTSAPFLCLPAIETLNESELEGRFIIVREDREEQKFRNAKSCKVTGLPGDVTWQRVKDDFRNAGDVRLPLKISNRSSFFARCLPHPDPRVAVLLSIPPLSKILHVDVLPGAEGTTTAVVRFADEISANNGKVASARVAFP
jgi:RNA recognition motif-containing protein